MRKPRLVVLTGAGISAESGIKTFRDADGLWEEYKVTDVATPEAWERDPALVLNFYNQRRKQLLEVQPNAGHLALVEAEQWFEILIITQNIDDLHERAGSQKVLHLHGQLRLAQSSKNPADVYPIVGWELKMGDLAKDGSQLRPHVVWFGEEVPNIGLSVELVQSADYFAVIGSSLNVYPAASLGAYAPLGCPFFLVDPQPVATSSKDVRFIQAPASTGTPELIRQVRELAGV